MMKQKKGSRQIARAKEKIKLSQDGLSQRQSSGNKAVFYGHVRIECPCRIEIIHQGVLLNQGQELQSPWLYYYPEGKMKRPGS